MRSLDRELVITQAREWMGSAHFTGTLLSYGLLGNNPAGAIAGVNALNWSQANVGPPFPVGAGPGYSLTASFAPTSGNSPVGYWVDPWGATPGGTGGPYNYAYQPLTGLPGISNGANNAWHDYTEVGGAARFTMPAEEQTLWEAQMACWIAVPAGNIIVGLAPATYAYRARYKTAEAVTGFQATCEIWAQNAHGGWGWDTTSPSYQCTVVLGRNFALVETFSLSAGIWRPVACPTGTSGSGTQAAGFIGLGVFEVWGVSWADWQAATGL
jgi:hypothetical protein